MPLSLNEKSLFVKVVESTGMLNDVFNFMTNSAHSSGILAKFTSIQMRKLYLSRHY